VPARFVQVAPDVLASLASIELYRVKLALLTPFVASHGTEVDREVVLVRAGGAGEGWGECVALSRPTYTNEWTDGAWAELRDDLGPALLSGRAIDVARSPMAWTAIETALLDLGLRGENRSLAAHLGATRELVACTAVIGAKAKIDVLLDEVAHRVDEGYRSVKLKIGPGRDVEPLGAVRAAWPRLAMAADANGSYASDDLGSWRALERFGLDYVEQPLAAEDLGGLARWRRDTAIPVALDESIIDLDSLERAMAADAVDLVNLKPGRVGGVAEATRLAVVARDAGLGVFVGGMLETGIGRAAALAVAAMGALDGCVLPTDLGPSSRYFADDLTEPFVLEAGGYLRVPDSVGIGVAPRPDRLAEVTTDRIVLRA
jgi:O-succinylbenzoate synthase